MVNLSTLPGDPLAALRRARPSLAPLVRRIGPFQLTRTPDTFRALLGSIIHQQISMAAARSIQRRLAVLAGSTGLTPARLGRLTDPELRSAGVSPQKIGYIRSLVDHYRRRRLSNRILRRLDDQAVIDAVTQVRGVGPWTAQMLLIFSLDRPDVWPCDDLGLRRALQVFLGMAQLPSAREAEPLGEPWKPYRSLATWYLWRSLENPIAPAISMSDGRRERKARGGRQ